MKKDVAAASLKMDVLVGYILLGGVIASAVLLSAGIYWHWAVTGNTRFQYAISGTNLFQFWLTNLRQLTAAQFRPRLLVNLGIGVLMLTPYVRVCASTLYFAFAERNLKYTIFTGFVWSVLTYSLFLR